MDYIKYILPGFFLLTGCMVGPKYSPPDSPLPSEFEEKGAVSQGDESLTRWWKQFDDPLLNELIDQALIANYDLKIAVERIEQTRAQYRIEKSYLWPEIDLNATATRSQISQNLISPSVPHPGGGSFLPKILNIFQVGFDAIWELDLFGKFRHARQAAYYTYEATQEEAQSVLLSLVSEVAVTYSNIRALQNKIDLTKQKIEADEEDLSITQALFTAGLDSEIQISTLVSTVESDKATLPSLETSLKQSIYTLAYLLGRAPEGFSATFSTLMPVPSGEGKVPLGLPSDLLRRRPDVKSAERGLAAATEEIGMAVADLFPHIGLTGISLGSGNKVGSSIGFESNRLKTLLTVPSRMLSFGAGINWNLIDFGRVRAQIDVKNSVQRQALLSYEQTVIASLKDVEGALVAYFQEGVRKESLNRKVEADRVTHKITEDLYRIGLANEKEVIQTRKALLSSLSTLVESEQSLFGDLVALYKAIGGNWDPSHQVEEESL